mgnify:CR=1 FL=1
MPLQILHRLVGDVLELLRERAVQKELDFQLLIEPGVPEFLRGDSHRLRQILINLLSNAIKYSPPQGGVQLTVSALAGGIEFTVADGGIGIPDEDLPHLDRKSVV